MTAPDDDDERLASPLDERMAQILAGGDTRSISHARRELRESGDVESRELIGRLDALEFVDSLAGRSGFDLPERLGEYRITDLLGRGGMGTVFEAFQESLERPVALKVLSPALTNDPGMRRRFRVEARANATLHHQHIVPVYGFGETAGYLYFTMERVDGVSLDRHITAWRADGGWPDPRDAARRFAGVADALAHAHRRGVLHRDIKPGNILVHPDGTLALADFGLSKMLNEVSMSMSAQGGFLGTLQYAAPEQAKGFDVSPASDLYSLGVTMFEALTGRLPLEGKTTEAMLDAVLHGEPKRLRSLLPKAPKDLDAVLHKLLQRDPTDRYTDGEALARDLLRVADDEPVKIHRHPMWVRAWRVVRKHPALSSAIAVAALLLIVVVWQWRVASGAREEAKVGRFRELIATALIAADREVGDAAGPPQLFEALTGHVAPRSVGSDEFFTALSQAQELLPRDEEPMRIRAAYMTDPLPPAAEAIRRGHGAAAIRELSVRIEALEEQSGLQSDSVDKLELYRLYVARAVASMTASFCDRLGATRDLVRAQTTRRGAFFPAVLMAVLDWRPSSGTATLFAALDEVSDKAPPHADGVVGALLIAVAGLAAPDAANLMEFTLEYRHRRELHLRGTELLQRANDVIRSIGVDEQLGLAAELRSLAEHAHAARSTPSELRRFTDAGRALLLEHVGPESNLRSWEIVYRALEQPRGFLPGDVGGDGSLEVRALCDYLALGPDPGTVRELWTRAQGWFAALPRHSIANSKLCAIAAQLAGLDRATAEAAADAWVRADSSDPAAYICRMRVRLGHDVDKAGADAATALQYAIDRAAVRAQILDSIAVAEATHPELADLRRAFSREGG